MLAVFRQRNSTAADLARLLACWLVVILLVQAQAALRTMVQGPAHRHVVVATQAGEHVQVHQVGQRHHHGADAVVLPAEGDAALDTAACLLLGMLVPLPVAYAWQAPPMAPLLMATSAWALRAHAASPPRRPPRR